MVDWALVSGMGDDEDFDESLFSRGHDYAEVCLSATGRFIDPSHSSAIRRGWSTLVGRSANDLVPRAGAPWSKQEERDLRAAAAKAVNLEDIAAAHGRTETAISQRLELLGYDRDALIAMDFADVELRVVSHLISDSNKGSPIMKMSASRLALLLAAFSGKPSDIPRTRTTSPDLAFLTIEGYLSQDGLGGHFITNQGRDLVDSVLGKASANSQRDGNQTSWSASRDTSVLDDRRFYLVASADCMKGGPHGRPQLKKPPVTVQGSNSDAEREAQRLAGISRGEKFFVLQATSVHEVKPSPASSRRL